MFEIVVDYGEVEAALRAIHGAARGLAGDKTATNARAAFQKAGVEKFGQSMDLAAAGAPHLFGHVYEYRERGESEHSVNATPTGRLWRIQQKGSGGKFTGRVFFLPSTKKKPIPDELVRDAAAAGRTLARHIFSNKARDLENIQTFQARAGVQKYSVRIGGDVDQPRRLVMQSPMGDTMWAIQRTVSNPFFGQFRVHWENFWTSTARTRIIAPINTAWTRTATSEVKRLVQSEIGRVVATPMPRNVPGFHQTVSGRPFAGRFNTSPSGRVSKAIERVLRDRWNRI